MTEFPHLDGFEVESLIGSGGMGSVFRARRVLDGKPVAIKVAGEEVEENAAGRFRERFLREARILQGLHHENLPEFYACGELPDRRLFIAMELLVGRPLASFTGASLEVLIPLFIQCGLALQVIAEAGVVHRDVSPDNFFVVEVGGRSVVKLIDFGISRDTGADADGLTRAGMFLGKSDYCSPEQTALVPVTQPIDWRSDLYSFGLTMHGLVTGSLPFSGGSLLEQLRARLQDPPRSAFEAVPDRGMRRLLARIVRADPQERPRSMESVVADLLRIHAELLSRHAADLEKTGKLKAVGRTGKVAAIRLPEAPQDPMARTIPAHRRRLTAAMVFTPAFVTLGASLMALGIAMLMGRETSDPDQTGSAWPVVSLLTGAGILVFMGFRYVRSRRTAKPGNDVCVPARPLSSTEAPRVPVARLSIRGDGEPRRIPLVMPGSGGLPAEIQLGRTPTDGSPQVASILRGPVAQPGQAVAGGALFVPFASRTVSSQHARLTRAGSGYQVENLSRTNPVVINGETLALNMSRRLKPGDVVELGEVTIVLEEG